MNISRIVKSNPLVLWAFLLIISAFSYAPPLQAQCFTCTQTVISGNSSISLGAGETLCITGNYTGSVTVNAAGASICIASGASWVPQNFNLNNSPTIDIYGDLAVSGNLLGGTVNVKNGGSLTFVGDNRQVANGAQLTVESGGSLISQGKLTILGSNTVVNINNGATASFNQNNLSSGAGLDNNGSGGLNIDGEVTIVNDFINNGPASVGSTGVLNILGEFAMGNSGGTPFINDGEVTAIDGAVSGTMGGTGTYTFSNNLIIGSSGQLIDGFWYVENFSSFTDGNCSGQITPNVTFWDNTSVDNDFDFGCSSATQGYLIGLPIPLPVELLNFNYYKISDNELQFYWEVAAEIDFSHYELEMGLHPSDMQSLQTIPAALWSDQSVQTYSSKRLPMNSSTTYYRLKMVDLDGSVDYSELVAVQASLSSMKVFPNPITNNQFQLSHESEEAILLSIFSIDGRLIDQQQLIGSEEYTVNLPETEHHSLYVIKAVSEGVVHSFTLQAVPSK